FDVAHNADGARTLASSLRQVELDRPVVALLCVLGDKDWRSMIDSLALAVDRFVLTNAPSAPASRAWSLTEARAHAESRGYEVQVIPSFDEALARVGKAGGVVLVTGSFHTVGDAMARLQVSPSIG
ncbi:MAG: glutamate ligase domain-containing protein, partial [Thermoanaerobaculia bacterium]